MKRKKICTFTMLLSLICSLIGCGSNASWGNGETGINSDSPSVTGSDKQDDSSGRGVYVPVPVSGDIKGNNTSLLSETIFLVDSVSQVYPGENVMLSGLSLNFALAMLANGADNEALTALEDFLGRDVQTLNSCYSDFMNREKSGSKNKLTISNSFWTDEAFPGEVREEYMQLLKDTYRAQVNEIPMNEKGIRKINQWAAKATDGLVKEALRLQDLTPDTSSIIINAILLDGKWESPFLADRTRDEEFTLADGSPIIVQGMHSQEYFYYENQYATGFRKDYDEGEYYMIAVLPKKEGDFVLADLDLEGLIKSGKSTSDLHAELNIMLPKTDFEVKYDLSEMLKCAGLEQIFNDRYHNFPGIFESEDVDFCSYVSSVLQNDRLIIDEDGTKAAAVTSIMVDRCTSALTEKLLQVYLNRPFAVLLMDAETEEPLFIAKIMKPLS